MATPANAFDGWTENASLAGGCAGVIVKVEEAIELDTPPRTASACTVDEALIAIALVYAVDEVVGTVPSVV
jgi:hypothetical protein